MRSLARAVVVVAVWHRFGCFSAESGIGSRWELSSFSAGVSGVCLLLVVLVVLVVVVVVASTS